MRNKYLVCLPVKKYLHVGMLTCWVLALLAGSISFGGVVVEYALPFYICCIALAVLWGVKLLFARPVSWVWSPLHVPVGLFVAYAAVRTFLSPVAHDSQLELLHILLYALVYFVAAANFYRPTDRQVIVWALMAVAVGQAMYGTWQFVTESNSALWMVRPQQYLLRGGGTYICPNHLAGFVNMVLALVLARLVVDPLPSRSLQKNVLFKILEVYVIGCAIAGLIASQSRAGWLSLAVAVIAALFWVWRVRALPPRVVDVCFGLVVAIAIFAYSRPVIRQRLENTFAIRLDYTFEDFRPVELRDASLGGRGPLNLATWRMAGDHLLLGTGPGTWQYFHPQYRQPDAQWWPRYAHNDALQFLAEYGLVGCVLMLGVIGCCFWQVVRFTRPEFAREQQAFVIGAATAVTGLLIHSFWDFNLHIPVNAFLLVTLLGLVAANGDRRLPFQRIELHTRSRNLLGVGVLLVAVVTVLLAVPVTMAERLTRRGDDARADGDFEAATHAYQQAIKFDRHAPDALLGLGDTYRGRLRRSDTKEKNDIAQALSAYQRAAALNRLDPRPYQRIAALYETLDDHNSALSAHQRSITLDPNNATYWKRLGVAHWRLRQMPEAVAALEKAAQLGDADAADYLRKLRPPKPQGR
jgi:O-antigen ligase